MSESAFTQQIEAPSVTERVTTEIRRAIVSGRLRPGEEFALRAVAGQLGVSFIPVREALRSLEAEGLLLTRKGRSAIVSPLEASDLCGVCRLRERVEPPLAAQASGAIDETMIDSLWARLPQCSSPMVDPDAQYDNLHAIYFELLLPAATSWEMRVVRLLTSAMERYIRAGRGTVDYSVTPPGTLIDALRTLLTAASEAPDVVAKATRELIKTSEAIALDCLAGVR